MGKEIIKIILKMKKYLLQNTEEMVEDSHVELLSILGCHIFKKIFLTVQQIFLQSPLRQETEKKLLT